MKTLSSNWKGVFAEGIYKVLTLILKVVPSHDLWVWHAFLGRLECLNDLNILGHSMVFLELYEDWAPKCEYICQWLQV